MNKQYVIKRGTRIFDYTKAYSISGAWNNFILHHLKLKGVIKTTNAEFLNEAAIMGYQCMEMFEKMNYNDNTFKK